jgi:hypothetical protein
MIGNRYPRS